MPDGRGNRRRRRRLADVYPNRTSPAGEHGAGGSKAYTATSLRMPPMKLESWLNPVRLCTEYNTLTRANCFVWWRAAPVPGREVVGAIGSAAARWTGRPSGAAGGKNAARDRKLGAKDSTGFLRHTLAWSRRSSGESARKYSERLCKAARRYRETPSTFSPALSYWRWHEEFLTAAGWAALDIA